MNDSPSNAEAPETSDAPPAQKKKKFTFWRAFWLAFLAASLTAAWYSFYTPSNNVAWAGSYASAQQSAADSGKPMVLFFNGEWCVPCRVMKRQVWADEEVTASVNAGFVPMSVDVDAPESAELMERYQVKGPPVTIITDAEGNALRWHAGGMGKGEFLELLNPSEP